MSGTPPRGLIARLYSAALIVLPPSIRRFDGDEMAETFAELWSGEPRRTRRAGLAVRAFGRLPVVAALEWLELLGITRDGRGDGMDAWGGHIRYAVRTLSKAPAFTLTTIALIGLGVGAVTTIFTVVDHVLLRPLPYPEAERLVTVQEGSHSGPVFTELQALDQTEAWVAGTGREANLVGEGDPVRVEVGMVSEGFFPFFGARPELGRLLVDADYEAANTAVLSWASWQTLFGGDPGIVGRTVRIDDDVFEIVGVLAQSFEPPQNMLAAAVDFITPIDWSQEVYQSADYWVFEVAGRLAPGATHASIQSQLDVVAERLAEEYPEARVSRSGEIAQLPLVDLQLATVERVRTGLSLLFGAVGLLLLVACLNVAHLFLARGVSRLREMAVRRALGAGAGGLLRQLLTESLMVGVAGGLLGLALAWVGLDFYLALNPESFPRSASVSVDLRVALFAALVSLATAVLFGLLPALRSVGNDLTNDLRGSARGSTDGRASRRLRSGLVVAEVALSLVLVAQAGLLLRSFMQVQQHDPGFDAAGVWTLPLTPTGIETPEQYVLEMDEVLVALERLPGVAAASFGLTQPFEYTGGGRCCWSNSAPEVDGVAHEDVRLFLHPVSRGYFETLALPLVAGAAWTPAQVDEEPTPAVITEVLALELFGSADASLGRVFGRAEGRQYRVTGVAADNKHYGLDQPDPTSVYVPVEIVPFTIPMAHMAVRIRGDAPDGFARTLREAVWAVQPDMPIPTVRTMDDWIAASVSGRRFDSALFFVFGVVGLLLAAAGLYGTLLYSVRQQRRELGIRLALGAGRGTVEREVVTRGVVLALTGAVAGILGSLWVGRLLEDRLFEVQAGDPLALGGAATVLLAAAAFASWLPARRAGRTDPLQTLKAE